MLVAGVDGRGGVHGFDCSDDAPENEPTPADIVISGMFPGFNESGTWNTGTEKCCDTKVDVAALASIPKTI